MGKQEKIGCLHFQCPSANLARPEEAYNNTLFSESPDLILLFLGKFQCLIFFFHIASN